MAAEPRADRPYMPQYGIAAADAGRGLLPWSWAQQRLAASHNYWISTTRPDGRPSASAVWGVWLDGRYFFSCAPGSRKAQNLHQRPDCVVTTERADEAVIVEGTASLFEDRAATSRIVAAYNEKYAWDMSADETFWVVEPQVVLGFIESKDEPGVFARRRRAGGSKPISVLTTGRSS